MENRELEIRQCRAQIQSLQGQLDALSARLDALDREETVVTMKEQAAPVPAPKVAATAAKPREKESWTNYQDLENRVGKNLFAVLASVLVLLGVGVFISTIYEQIPEFVKILAIYVFGFALLGSGLYIYAKNKNNFWLGVASCGLAELLVSVITSHSYFAVLSLPATFGLILVWILGSFWLTRFQPTVFKTIGYIGFTVSMILGQDLLTERDLGVYLTLLVAYVVLAVFFMVTNRAHGKMNTVMAFANVVNLSLFLNMPSYLPEGLDWISALAALGIAAVFHGVYLLRAKLSRRVYPVFAMVTLAVVSLFWTVLELEVILPMALLLVFGFWCVGHWAGSGKAERVCYCVFAAFYLTGIASCTWSQQWALHICFAVFAAAAYVLYYLTKKRDAAWLGLVCFGLFYWFLGRERDSALVWCFLLALGFFGLNCSKALRRDTVLETAWYLLVFWIAFYLKERIQVAMYRRVDDLWAWRTTSDALFFALYAGINTTYLHFAMADKEKIMRVTGKAVVLMALQLYLLVNCSSVVRTGLWFKAALGIVGSMLILAYSLRYSVKTKGRNRKLTVWQFVKFTLYCWIILVQLTSPSIVLNICLLLIAIAAVILGFRLDQKAVRIYGLVLSLLDVVILVLLNIDYSDSLQLAGGIVLCGALCFVISFIYSKISRAADAQRE